jgi:putative holliday junction resolvase
MIALPPELEALAALPRGERLIGLDLGTKTIGVAVSDVGRQIASPVETIARSKFSKDAERLRELVGRLGVGAFVLGLPVNMDGTEGPRAQASRAFARNLGAAITLPVVLWDERLSTAAVTRTLVKADRSRRRRAEIVDQLAAAYILQGLLDRLRFHQAKE